jgi:hypothetical protein
MVVKSFIVQAPGFFDTNIFLKSVFDEQDDQQLQVLGLFSLHFIFFVAYD